MTRIVQFTLLPNSRNIQRWDLCKVSRSLNRELFKLLLESRTSASDIRIRSYFLSAIGRMQHRVQRDATLSLPPSSPRLIR